MSVKVNDNLCLGCGQCEPVCPEKAIMVWGIARVNDKDCTECLICLGYCPVKGALEEVRNG
ncbi:MAG: 4Fe-4S binding protein [Desulfobacterales bacterium]|nr:4Fe-4S binding protein [Desulfobacteraceae bacterium]MBT7086696.1 4Fe-4S binding protein [Desulfobacterales bacterium]MBT7698505.1 4Fe-4S binding protein [Desulfobacterales bacterium]